VATAANDARVKAGVAIQPWQDGKGVERRAFAPSAAQQAAMVRLARSGSVPTTDAAAATMNGEESKLAFAEYQPFRIVDQIPKDTAMRYLDSHDVSAAADFLAKSLGRTPSTQNHQHVQ
jgi:DNA replication initiation complex subunit (GINS family)